MRATGQPSKLGQFRVHKVAPGGIRMFESMAQPGKYIRMKDGKVDCLVCSLYFFVKYFVCLKYQKKYVDVDHFFNFCYLC